MGHCPLFALLSKAELVSSLILLIEKKKHGLRDLTSLFREQTAENILVFLTVGM
jgi:hypothetical protein